jgi:diguanylate cyclase (GGDEF)-like protein
VETDVTNEGAASGQLQLLSDAADALARSSDLDTAVERLLTLAVDALGASLGVVYLQDPDRVELQLGVTVGVDEALAAGLEGALAVGEDVVAATARDRSSRTVSGGGVPAVLSGAGIATALLRGLTVSRGGIDIPVGVLVVGWDDEVVLAAEHEELASALADLTAVAIDRSRLASMILERSEWFERMAHTDPLTGLANQRTFARVLELELARAARQGSEISLAVFDVDGLTDLNAGLGHQAGDDVLRAIATVLAESVRLVDTVARYGGDEFVVIAPGSAGATVAKRVVDGVAALPAVGAHQLSVSAGVAKFPTDGANADELLAAAQAALASARSIGPGSLSAAPVGSSNGS